MVYFYFLDLSRYLHSFIYSFIPLACAECDDSLSFSGASSIPLCYVLFPSTFFHQPVFHSPSLHLAIYFLVYLSASLFPNSYMRVNQKVKAIFKLRGNRDRQELAHYTVLTMPIEDFSHSQYSALSSVEWQQRGRKHGCSFARLLHWRTRHSAVSLDRRSETCRNSPSYVGSVWTEHRESTKGLWVGPLKEVLHGRRFTSNEEVKEEVHTWLREQPKSFFCAGIQKLVEWYNKCIALQGDYVEKWYVKLLTVTSITNALCCKGTM